MSRASAYEKIQVAHQLRQRSVLFDAFAQGRISYSAARAMARMTDPAPEVDEAIVAVAEAGTVRDVERMVGVYLRHADQHRRPSCRDRRRGVRVRPGYDGSSTIEITLDDVEVEEFMACLEAHLTTPAVPTTDSDAAGADPDEEGFESARVDSTDPVPLDAASRQEMRADAVMSMTRTALIHAQGGQACGADRYLVHVVSHAGSMTLIDGTPLDPATAERIQCDSSQVRLLLGSDWEPLAAGRKTRYWNTAQRRAARVRDGGHCRFPGCARRTTDLHHLHWWSRGGSTDITNGYLVCPRHHTMLHDGYGATGDPNRQLSFHRPDGTYLGATEPVRRR
jgi:hypothetical protein